jgi:hypothetical protein
MIKMWSAARIAALVLFFVFHASDEKTLTKQENEEKYQSGDSRRTPNSPQTVNSSCRSLHFGSRALTAYCLSVQVSLK